MKLATRGRYALRMMLDIAKNGADSRPVSLATVSERTGLSRGYLEQLVIGLRSAGLVRSYAGRFGGYRLHRTPGDIAIGDIIEAVTGPVTVVDCISDSDDCPRSEFCECRVVYGIINQRISRALREFTLADLLDPSWVRNEELSPPDQAGAGRSAQARQRARSSKGSC